MKSIFYSPILSFYILSLSAHILMVECHLDLVDKVSSSAGKHSEAKNYASAECAKVVETNPEAKKASHILNAMIDEYMLNPCKTRIWFVIELCETIQATHIEIANYELFSSTPKDFTVYFSDTYPAPDWKLVGQFTATDSRTLQAFDLNQVGFGKFIRVELHSHYGNEHYCPISEVKIFGASMVDEYEKSENTSHGGRNDTKKAGKTKRKTSAFRVYRSMMMTPSNICGLSRPKDKKNVMETSLSNLKQEPPQVVVPPTQQPAVNRTQPLKPSIFVELNNKVKALEAYLIEEMERRLNEMERKQNVKFEKFTRESRSSNHILYAIVIAFLVYRLMLDLL